LHSPLNLGLGVLELSQLTQLDQLGHGIAISLGLIAAPDVG